MKQKIWLPLFSAVIVLLAGCASFDVVRTGQFINMDNEMIHVEYGEKEHKEQFRGLDFTFKGAVHLRLPDGKGVTCLQTTSSDGMRYLSKDKHYLYFEKGLYCILFLNGERIFEGIYCHESKE